jgi:hypothetical protein
MTKTSKVWYLLPLLFGLLGGIIGWYLIKKQDKGKAKLLIIIGFIPMIIYIILTSLFLGLSDANGFL